MDKQILILRTSYYVADKYKYPRGMGKIDCNHRFDATFFGIHSKMCMAMDSMNQIIMERAYEAIIDSGNKCYIMKTSGMHNCLQKNGKRLISSLLVIQLQP